MSGTGQLVLHLLQKLPWTLILLCKKISILCKNSCANNMPSRTNQIASFAQPPSASQPTSDRPLAFGLG